MNSESPASVINDINDPWLIAPYLYVIRDIKNLLRVVFFKLYFISILSLYILHQKFIYRHINIITRISRISRIMKIYPKIYLSKCFLIKLLTR